ncbi:ATP-binding protein [Dongia rigui]|uniref:ATP-binding protein n=1 Tax=Dongia rigui TaxID=940149 RepID=A0ABU5DZB8_9PROT|nr:ATP-binding protein [Dongia rigui]MDY0872663.1 ATP-binding protein [Dongia rigui]
MIFLILRRLTHSELGMFHEYRRQGKEGSKQRAVNFDWDVVDRVFPAAKDSELIYMDLRYDTDIGVSEKKHWLKRQDKNWRLEGNCPKDKCFHFVEPGCLFAMEINSSKTPASGAWAIFPPDDRTTRAIFATGETSNLAKSKSGMIALHGEEGQKVRRILCESRPDLFGTSRKGKGKVMPNSHKDNSSGRKQLPPNAPRLIDILSSVGHSMPSAVADIVDNAIGAEATNIKIFFGRPDTGHGRWLTIADDGKGMDPSTLDEAMRIGSVTDYDDNALGKYGYGLKGASWSQAKVLTVVTKQDGQQAHHLTWDKDRLGEWDVLSDPLEAWEQEATRLGKQGTVVLWKNMRPPQASRGLRGLDPYSWEIMELQRHLALVFHRFIEGKAAGRKRVTISINGKPIAANNPVGHPLTAAYDRKTIKIPTENGDAKVEVQAFLLPSEDEIEAHHKAGGQESINAALDQIGLHGKRNESQGLFIYRNDRLIKWGGWHQMWATSDEKTKLARVVVNFGQALDDAMEVNISKQFVQLPLQLQEAIKKIATDARRDSQSKYRKASRPTGKPGDAGPRVSRAGKPNPPPGSTGTGVAAPPTPKIAVREVKTTKFVWKVTRGLAGDVAVQVSEADPALSALVRQIGKDEATLSHLAAFLDRLDQMEVQKHLLNKKAD